jgi:hypothetical protein
VYLTYSVVSHGQLLPLRLGMYLPKSVVS